MLIRFERILVACRASLAAKSARRKRVLVSAAVSAANRASMRIVHQEANVCGIRIVFFPPILGYRQHLASHRRGGGAAWLQIEGTGRGICSTADLQVKLWPVGLAHPGDGLRR